MQKHLIYKQKVTLHLSGEGEAYAFQERVSRLLKNELNDSLERILDDAFPPDKTVRIDSLQIDLGNISAQNFEPEFKMQFVEALTKSLSAKKSSISSNSGGTETILNKAQSLMSALKFFLEKGYLPWYSAAKNVADWEAEMLNDLSDSEYDDFIAWLKDNHEENPVLIERITAQFSDKFIGDVLLKINPSAGEPWRLIFSDLEFIIKTLYTPEGTDHAVTIAIDPDILAGAARIGSAYHKATIRAQIWQASFLVLLDNNHREPVFYILKRLAGHFGISSPSAVAVEEKSLKERLKTRVVTQAFHKFVADLKTAEKRAMDAENDPAPSTSDQKRDRALQPEKDESADTPQNENSPGASDNEGGQAARPSGKKQDKENAANEEREGAGDLSTGAGTRSKNALHDESLTVGPDRSTQNGAQDAKIITKNIIKKPLKETPPKTKRIYTSEGDVIDVHNSGIVLLHPFLKPYFEGLGLLAGWKFIDDDARARAVLLLNYLATGETEAAEFDLTLQKCICGFPQEDTLIASIILTDREKTESENLLNSVISHWEPLRNTSVDGFRGTFLMRNGNLELRENGWLLKVEQKTVDILLGKLPWGFSTVRLPWMQHLLSVDWY